MSRSKISLAIIFILLILGLIATLSRTNTDVQIDQLDLTTKQQRIDIAEEKAKALEKELEEAKGDVKKLKEVERKAKEQDIEIESLRDELQSKRDKLHNEAQNVALASPETPTAQVTPSGDWVAQCHAWAAQAGIVLDSWAIELIDRESDCSPTVWNMGGSGACGIAQALPCSKLANGINTPPPEQLKWMLGYVMGRYGSWQAAVQFHDANNWY